MSHERLLPLRTALRNVMGCKADKEKLKKDIRRDVLNERATMRQLAADLCCELRVKKLNERDVVQKQLQFKRPRLSYGE